MKIAPLTDILAAREAIAAHVHRTPMFASNTIANAAGLQALGLKCECFQKTGSFKVRGALNAVRQLDQRARDAGVVTVSAGNHAQAVAWSARSAGARCTVVMPAHASKTKVAASEGYGATVILHGTSAEAFARASEIARDDGMTLVHPFDDARVIAGAASVGLEIMEQFPDAEIVVVPIGGGGLIAGIASAIRQTHPGVRIVGVEPTGAAAMRQSRDAGKPVRLERIETIADGLAAPYAGELTFPIIEHCVDDLVTVDDDVIAQAMALLLTRAKVLAEPAGATATAALLAGRVDGAAGKRVVAVLSGGNVDLDRIPRA